ncbi:MAG: trypsin-like peptidase domain-containing protein [Chloroflexi bacterium]|nr:trypsin-like peptidase domain-containing protein [Chloroflexota bacterium]
MNILNNLKKFFIGGAVALATVAVVACSGSTDAGDPLTPTAEQVANVDASASTFTGQVARGGADSPVTEAGASNTPIQAIFEDTTTDGPAGDALPEIADIGFNELTPAEIVAAQGTHLAGIYETAVQSVVFIRVGTSLREGSGSGFVWDTEGHVVTNYHVVQGANSITVKFFNGREYRAEMVAFDPDSDLAVIRLMDVEHELVPLKIGSSSDLRPGEMAIALGNPFGEEFTMTTGIVSAVSRTLFSGFSRYQIPAVVQTDTAINPGNSGGPLLDMDGAVIGVNTQIQSDSRQNSGVGFAVPADLVSRIVPSLIEDGSHEYALMGISGEDVGIKIRENANLPGNLTGAMVMRVSPGGPADGVGIRQDSGSRSSNGNLIEGRENWDGDVIVSIDSVKMKSMDDLVAYLALNTAPGDDIVVGVFRDGVEIAISITLGARPTSL